MSQDYGIVILSFNHPEITARCVRSALNFVSPEQILLFHNGSQEVFVDQLKEQFPNIWHEAVVKNSHFSGGANKSLTLAAEKWKWILFLTNDTELTKFQDPTNFSPGLYAPMVWHRKLQSLDSWGGALHLPTAHLRHLRSKTDYLSPYEKFYVPGTAFLIDSESFKISNGFDESLETFWEDVDFSIRLANNGVTVFTCQGIEVLHLGGKTVHKDPYYTLFLFQRNRWIVSRRYIQKNMRLMFYYSWIEEYFRIASKLRKANRIEDIKKVREAFWTGITR